MANLQSLEIAAPHGKLEALLRLPDRLTEARMAAIVCHPHPLGGGTMHNKVVFRLAQALGDLGMPVLRFNFRGVGQSTGSYDEGRGEPTILEPLSMSWHAAFPRYHSAWPAFPLVHGSGFQWGAPTRESISSSAPASR